MSSEEQEASFDFDADLAGRRAQVKKDNNVLGEVDPNTPDPENLPETLGWNIRVRPYSFKTTRSSSIIDLNLEEDLLFLQHQVNVARVVDIGPCCWNRPNHRNADGERFEWVQVGDFISYPRNTGVPRKFKGISFVLLADDEIVDRLSDPMIMCEDSSYSLDIPQEHLEKYNTIYNKNYNKRSK